MKRMGNILDDMSDYIPREGIEAFICKGEKNTPGLRERKKGHKVQGE